MQIACINTYSTEVYKHVDHIRYLQVAQATVN